jgi:hypothetical protein
MGKQLTKLSPRLHDLIAGQKLFFVATARGEGKINVSPKGMDTFRILTDTRVLWLNLTGSGNETAAHLKYNKRMTIMFCAFEGPPLILRLYGKARVYHPRESFWEDHIGHFPTIAGSRQLVAMDIEMVQTSCGMGVPYMDYKGERGQLDAWAAELGEQGLASYKKAKNSLSLDGHDTGIF